jgi:hypothetical protein
MNKRCFFLFLKLLLLNLLLLTASSFLTQASHHNSPFTRHDSIEMSATVAAAANAAAKKAVTVKIISDVV